MEKNIFEGAKFGDKFLTRDGRVAIFWFKHEESYILILDYKEVCEIQVYADGSNCMNKYGKETSYYEKYYQLDIVSRYQEPIDEDKLDEIVECLLDDAYCDEDMELERKAAIYGCKLGYKKAKSE